MIDLFLALLIATLGLVFDIGVESKSTLVIGGFLYTQHVVKCGLPFMTFLHIFLQRSGLCLVLFSLPYKVSSYTSTSGS